MEEFAFIEQLRRCELDQSLLVGIGDDAAVVDTGQNQLAISTDTMVENVHFFPLTPAAAIGFKLVEINRSDLIAMGAKAQFATLNLCLPQLEAPWINAFFEGFNHAMDAACIRLIGGNTTRAGEATIGLTVFGAQLAAPVLRSTARLGDQILVSGTLGGAAKVLQELYANPLLRSEDLAEFQAWLRPNARGDLLEFVQQAHAAMDISDGLLQDLMQMCQQSSLDAQLDLAAIPIAAQATLEQALHGGEDYQLLLAWPQGRIVPQGFSSIGRFLTPQSESRAIRHLDGKVFEDIKGWDHFNHA